MNGLGKAWVKRKEVTEVREIPLNEIHRYRRSGWLTASKEEFDAYSRKMAEEKAAQERARKAASAETAGPDPNPDNTSTDPGRQPDPADDGKPPAVETKGAKKGPAGK